MQRQIFIPACRWSPRAIGEGGNAAVSLSLSLSLYSLLQRFYRRNLLYTEAKVDVTQEIEQRAQ